MDKLPPFGCDVLAAAGPTYQAFGDLLRRPERVALLNSVKREEHHYGTHPRQMLDIYCGDSENMETAENEQREPILIFIHGGGFTHGGRREPLIADDVVYRGLGYFGARELGYTTVVMDYRLLQHGASFDSGGEDLDLVIKWIESSLCGSDDNDDNARDLVIIGNSAGGVHLMSWPFDDAFTATRSRLMHAGAHLRLKTAVILSATMLLDPTISAMQDSLLRYFGDEQRVILNSPLNLMNLAAVCGNDGGPVVGGVPLTSWPPLLFHHNRVRPSICGRHGSKIRKGMG